MRGTSEEVVYDLLSRLNDSAYLHGHPLAAHAAVEGLQRGEALRQLLLEEIEHLKPPDTTPRDDPAWRPWQALWLRFVEQRSPVQVQDRMGLSERQVRREQSRGIGALAALLGDRLSHYTAAFSGDAFRQAADALEVSPTELDAREILYEVALVLRQRYHDCGTGLQLPQDSFPLYADRITLRQVLARVLSELASQSAGATVTVELASRGTEVVFRLTARGRSPLRLEPGLLQECNYLAELSLGRVEVEGSKAVACVFPARRPFQLLLIDDEPAAAQLLRRCVEGYGVRVLPVHDPAHAVEEAIQTHPDVIVLDVLMPGRDGWEVLQQLQSTPETRHVPVIVCSVWRDPELALTLGAREFIRKPLTRPVLLQALERVLPSAVEGESRPG